MKYERISTGSSVEDYSESPFYPLLKKLPTQLAQNHIRYIESENLSDSEALQYLSEIVSARQEVVKNTVVSDSQVQEMLGTRVNETMQTIETHVFHNPDNYLGQGMTAKVKLLELTDEHANKTLPVAVKYVVSPTKKTISAAQEHDVLKEVERIRQVEKMELQFANRSKYIRVPHPYFHHATDTLQCYGMEMIDGMTFEQIMTEGMLYHDFVEKLKDSDLLKTAPTELAGVITRFFETMHTYCLHGDIKPRNLMLGSNGMVYVIDFGQSILIHDVPGGAEDKLENLKDDEINGAMHILTAGLNKIRKELTLQ